MPQNKRQIKLTTILLLTTLTTILISQFFLISLAKTEIYFSLYDNPETAITENINKAEKFIDIAMYTWTSSASTRNDENLLVIDDEEVILRFRKQFERLWENKFSIEIYSKANINLVLIVPSGSIEPTPPTSTKILSINTASIKALEQL